MVRADIDAREEGPGERGRGWRALVAGVVVVGVIGGAGLIWFFSGDAPAAVDLEATAAAVTETTDGLPVDGDIAGTWTVDSSVGSFSVTEDTTASFAGFRVEEVLNSVGSTTAVGRTPDVSGSITIDGATLTAAEIVVDLTDIVSDRSRRDDAIQRALGTGSNPEATFVLAKPVELGDAAAAGEIVEVVVTGDLTINGVTNAIEIPIEAQLLDGTILITGSTGVVFADYDVEAPTAPIVLSVDDHGILEFQLWLAR